MLELLILSGVSSPTNLSVATLNEAEWLGVRKQGKCTLNPYKKFLKENADFDRKYGPKKSRVTKILEL